MIYVTSDLHLGHNKMFLYEPRGFADIQEHNEKIIELWNSMITDEDDVYILGDLVLGDIDAGMEYLKQLKGNLHIIYGNHDTDNKIARYAECNNIVEMCGYATVLKYKKYHFYLSHYPTIVSNYDENKPLRQRVINLCGHTHSCNKWRNIEDGLIYHCELDAHNNMPVSIDTIIEDIKEKLYNEA